MSKVSIRNEELVSWAKSYKGPKFHAMLCDPPYGIGFMGKKWDSHGGPAAYEAQAKQWGEAILPHLYPGALVFMFGGTRTWHRLAAGMEDAGFEMFDTVLWLYGQGLPKAQDIGKLIDRKNLNGRRVRGKQVFGRKKRHNAVLTIPASAEAASWSGHKTPAFKPAYEPILCFRTPRGNLTYSELALKYGTGSLNIDSGRIGNGAKKWDKPKGGIWGKSIPGDQRMINNHLGRYPANVIFDEESAQLLDAQSGFSKSRKDAGGQPKQGGGIYLHGMRIRNGSGHTDEGGASRFFYVAKASKRERNAGLAEIEPRATTDGRKKSIDNPYQRGKTQRHNAHPCVKPLALTRYLAKLLLPPATVAPRRLVVPFLGSGSEMIGALQAGWDEIVGIEQNACYCKIAGKKRIAFYQPGSTTRPLVKRVEVVSTFLYSGRKSWFVQHAAKYFRAHPCQTLIEPFAGSAVVGLSLLHAGIIERLVLVEKDERIVCLLNGLLNHPTLADRYAAFDCTPANVDQLLRDEKSAFRYLVQSRCSNRAKFDGGLRTAIDSRWCRDLVVENVRRIYAMRNRIEVIEGDALEGGLIKMMRQYAADPSVGCFADPTYTADVKSKGHTVYLHHKLNHQKLFSLLSRWRGPFLLTEDNSRMVRNLALSYRFAHKKVRMVTAENKKKKELVLWRKRRIV